LTHFKLTNGVDDEGSMSKGQKESASSEALLIVLLLLPTHSTMINSQGANDLLFDCALRFGTTTAPASSILSCTLSRPFFTARYTSTPSKTFDMIARI